MNNTYIHLRKKDLHIYIYKREKIYKELLTNIIIINVNTYLIPL
jgi:hypothetical protein